MPDNRALKGRTRPGSRTGRQRPRVLPTFALRSRWAGRQSEWTDPNRKRRVSMSTIVGSGEYRYRIVEDWAKLPDGWAFKEVAAGGGEKDDNGHRLKTRG